MKISLFIVWQRRWMFITGSTMLNGYSFLVLFFSFLYFVSCGRLSWLNCQLSSTHVNIASLPTYLLTYLLYLPTYSLTHSLIHLLTYLLTYLWCMACRPAVDLCRYLLQFPNLWTPSLRPRGLNYSEQLRYDKTRGQGVTGFWAQPWHCGQCGSVA